MPFLKSCAMTPVAKTQRPAFMPCANLILPRRVRRGAAALHSCWSFSPSSFIVGSVACMTAQGKIGRLDIGLRSTHYSQVCMSCGATDENCIAMVSWSVSSCRERHRLGPGGELSEPHHHHGGAVPGRRLDRRARAPCLAACCRTGSVSRSWSRTSTGGSGTIGAAYVVRAAPDGYTLHANSIADAQNIHYMPVPYNADG